MRRVLEESNLDKRLGKRRLEKLLPEIERQAKWLHVFSKYG